MVRIALSALLPGVFLHIICLLARCSLANAAYSSAILDYQIYCFEPLPTGTYGDDSKKKQWSAKDFNNLQDLCSFIGNSEGNMGGMCYPSPTYTQQNNHRRLKFDLVHSIEVGLFDKRILATCVQGCSCNPSHDDYLAKDLNAARQAVGKSNRVERGRANDWPPWLPVDATWWNLPTANGACGSTCNSNHQCNSQLGSARNPRGKCVCRAKPVAKGLFAQGSCAMQARRGPWGRKRRRSLSELRGLETEQLVEVNSGANGWACPCNASYVSQGCCDSNDGLVWERVEANLGAMVEEMM